jgi:hypothetical protein
MPRHETEVTPRVRDYAFDSCLTARGRIVAGACAYASLLRKQALLTTSTCLLFNTDDMADLPPPVQGPTAKEKK